MTPDPKLQVHEQLINELRTKQSDLDTRLNNLGSTVGQIQNAPEDLGQIDNVLRNSKLRHSWDTWDNKPPVPGDEEEEAAHVFTHGPDTAVEVYSGAITATDTTLTIDPTDDVEFVDPDDVGLEIVVEGAGTDGTDLVTTIASVTSDSEAELDDPAVTTVSDVRVRWRLQTLGLASTHEGTPNINDTLKDPAQSDFEDNITDPQWNKAAGYATIGGRNSIDFPMGYWNRTTDSFVHINLLEPNKIYYLICRLARRSAIIKPRGFLGVQLWDDSDGKHQVIEGGRFTLAVRVEGEPTSTVSSQYKIIARTDQGETLESNIVTINRPADAAFVTDRVYAVASWTTLPGVRIFEVWRKTGATYELLTVITNSQSIYLDNNAVKETGLAFPTGDVQRKTAAGYLNQGDLENVVVNGFGDWDHARLLAYVPSTYDTRATTKQWARVVLTQECDREVTDGVTASTITVTSVTAEFEEEDEGLNVTIVSGNDTFTGTVDNYISPTEIEVDSPVGFTASDCTITIEKGGRNGLLIGEFGLSINKGTWAANHDDSNTAQNVASNPDGSPIGPNDPGGGGSGGILCVRKDMRVRLHSDEAQIQELPISYTQVGHLTASGNLRPNCVLKKDAGTVDCLLEIRAGHRTIFCTPSELFFRNFANFDAPTAAHLFEKGDTIAMNPFGVDMLATIETKRTHFGRFEVETYLSLSPGHVSIIEGFYRHNLKQPVE